jgi:hypothetical protein
VFARKKSDLTYHRRFSEGDCSAAHVRCSHHVQNKNGRGGEHPAVVARMAARRRVAAAVMLAAAVAARIRRLPRR